MASSGRQFYLVERYAPSISPDIVAAAARRLRETSDETARHVCTVLVSAEETCLSVFEAMNAHAVERANQHADFPLDRIVEVEWYSGTLADPPMSTGHSSHADE